MHDVCTEQHVGNTKCARPFSFHRCGRLLPVETLLHPRAYHYFPSFSARSLYACILLCSSTSEHVHRSPFPTVFSFHIYGGKTSTIKLTTLSERGPTLDAMNVEKRVTAASWPSVGSGVDRWVNACTGQDAFLAGVGLLLGRRNGLTCICRWPFANFHPP